MKIEKDKTANESFTRVVARPEGDMASLPEWQRTNFVSDDGNVLMPADVFTGGAGASIVLAGHDGETILFRDGHVYLSAEWLANEYPEQSSGIMRCKRNIVDANERSLREESKATNETR